MNQNNKYDPLGNKQLGDRPELNFHPPTPTGNGWVSNNLAVTGGGGRGHGMKATHTRPLPQIIPNNNQLHSGGGGAEHPTDGVFRKPLNPPHAHSTRIGANGHVTSNLSVASYNSIKGWCCKFAVMTFI